MQLLLSEDYAMYWLDIAAIGVLFVFGIMGFSGLLNRLRGLVFGIFLGAVIIGMTPYAITKFDTNAQIDLERSFIMRYFDKFVPISIRSKYQGKIVNSDRSLLTKRNND